MAQLTLLEAAKRSQNRLFQSIAVSIVTTNETAAVLPFKTYTGQTMSYLREGAAPSTGFIPDAGTMGAASTGTSDLVNVPVRRIGSDLDVDSLADDLSQGSEVGIQVAKKAKATFDLVLDKVVNGGNTTSHALGSVANPFAAIGAAGVGGIAYGPWLDSGRFGPGELKYTQAGQGWQFRAPGDADFGDVVPATTNGSYTLRSFNKSKYLILALTVASATANGRTWITFASSNNEFDGMNRVLSPSMVRASLGGNGDAFDIAILDDLLLLEKVRTNRVFMMPGKLINKFKAAQRALGGTTPEHIRLPGYSGPTLSYSGIPVLQNDHILSNEVKGSGTTLSSIYLASLDSDSGLYMGVPGTGTAIDVEGDPRNVVVQGWRIESLGSLEAVAHRRTRVQFYGALGLRSELALARASEIVTA